MFQSIKRAASLLTPSQPPLSLPLETVLSPMHTSPAFQQVLRPNQKSDTSLARSNSAVKEHFMAFCSKGGIGDTENDLCKEEVFRGFGFYLLNEAIDRRYGVDAIRNEDNMMSGASSANYVGMMKEIIRLRYPHNGIWINHDTEKGHRNNSGGWFTLLKLDIILLYAMH